MLVACSSVESRVPPESPSWVLSEEPGLAGENPWAAVDGSTTHVVPSSAERLPVVLGCSDTVTTAPEADLDWRFLDC